MSDFVIALFIPTINYALNEAIHLLRHVPLLILPIRSLLLCVPQLLTNRPKLEFNDQIIFLVLAESELTV